MMWFFFFSSRRRHTRFKCDWSSDVCSSDLQEIGGVLAAVMMIENARVKQGRLIIVPQANRSGFTHTDPMEAYLHSFTIDTPAGPPWFPVRVGVPHPADPWPDPHVFVHSPGRQRAVRHPARPLN